MGQISIASQTAQEFDVFDVILGPRVYPTRTEIAVRIKVGKIRYVFIAQTRTANIIHSPWTTDPSLSLTKGRIYARTEDNEIFLLTKAKVLSRLLETLAGRWLQVHQSILVNRDLVYGRAPNYAKRVTFVDHANPDGDAVDVSKRRWPTVSKALER